MTLEGGSPSSKRATRVFLREARPARRATRVSTRIARPRSASLPHLILGGSPPLGEPPSPQLRWLGERGFHSVARPNSASGVSLPLMEGGLIFGSLAPDPQGGGSHFWVLFLDF